MVRLRAVNNLPVFLECFHVLCWGSGEFAHVSQIRSRTCLLFLKSFMILVACIMQYDILGEESSEFLPWSSYSVAVCLEYQCSVLRSMLAFKGKISGLEISAEK